MACVNYDNVCTWIRKDTWLVIPTVFSKLEDFVRTPSVTYTVKLVLFRKQCKKSSFCYCIPLTGSDIGPVNHPLSHFKCDLFVQMCSSWQDSKLHSASRGPMCYHFRWIKMCTITELLVFILLLQKLRWEICTSIGRHRQALASSSLL